MDEEKKEADCEAFDEDKEEGEDGVGEEKEEEDDGVEENEEEDDGVCEEEEEEVHEVGEDREEDHEIFGNLTKNPFKSERMFQNTELLDVEVWEVREAGIKPLQALCKGTPELKTVIPTENSETAMEREGSPSGSSSETPQETKNCEEQNSSDNKLENISDIQL
ncbi:uncharacterized protein [Periplaneta americana]|uniref:uncharacterized protein isoform X1 n=1 Tax=Periplaneta americana TaxID=6978 RepID=UPI0037E78AD3